MLDLFTKSSCLSCADISLQQYKAASRNGDQIHFICPACRLSVPSSSLSVTDADNSDEENHHADDDDGQDESFTATEVLQEDDVAVNVEESDIGSDCKTGLQQDDDENEQAGSLTLKKGKVEHLL